jgi:hypothetical protein
MDNQKAIEIPLFKQATDKMLKKQADTSFQDS